MTDEQLLIEEIYHAIGSHILVDLDKEPINKEHIHSAKYTANWIINKIELYYKNRDKK